MTKPPALDRFEARLSGVIPVSAHLLSSLKLLVVTPLVVVVLSQAGASTLLPVAGAGLMLLFFALDYLDGVVARGRGTDSRFGRVFDRVTDYPLLVALSYFCVDAIPVELLAIKLALDLLVLALFVLGKGSTENRIRTSMSYALVLALLCLSQGWAPSLISADSVSVILLVNILFTALVALYNLEILQKRFIADALSAGNLSCGLASIAFASQGRPEMCLLMLMVGGLMDGMDGLAARRWGSTRWGVYADDVADGVNFGLAPGAAVYFVVGGIEGAILGGLFALFTVTRLVFFTLNVQNGDPNYFAGVPSTAGGALVLCAAILFPGQPALVGLLVGAACVQMSSFDTRYKHLGRAVAKKRRRMLGLLPSVVALIVGAILWGPKIPVAIILTANLIYGLLPVPRHFARLRSLAKTEAGPPESNLGVLDHLERSP